MITLPAYVLALVRAYANQWSPDRIAGAINNLYGIVVDPAELRAFMQARLISIRETDMPEPSAATVQSPRIARIVRALRKSSGKRIGAYAAIRIRKLQGAVAFERAARARAETKLAERAREADEIAALTKADLASQLAVASLGQAPLLSLAAVVRRHMGSVEPDEVDRKLASLMREVTNAMHARLSQAHAPAVAPTAIVQGQARPICTRCSEPFERKTSERICQLCYEASQAKLASAPRPIARALKEPGPPMIQHLPGEPQQRQRRAGRSKLCKQCHTDFHADPPNSLYCDACAKQRRAPVTVSGGVHNRVCKACKDPFFANPKSRKYCMTCRGAGIATGQAGSFVCHGCEQLFDRKTGDMKRNFCYACAPEVDLDPNRPMGDAPDRSTDLTSRAKLLWREKPRCGDDCRHATPSKESFMGFVCAANAGACLPFQVASLYEPRK